MMRVALAYNFNDDDWLGGRNYFVSLLSSVAALAPKDVQLIFVTGRRTKTAVPDMFPWLEVLRTPWMDRLHPLWVMRQSSLRTSGTDPLFARFLARQGVDILSHAGPLSPGGRVLSLPWLYDFQFLHLPQFWQPRHLRWAHKRTRDACRHGDGLILSSQDAVGDLERFAPDCVLPRHVLHFVSNPVDLQRLPERDSLLQRYALPERYVHLPNQFWTNKNHRLVLEALARLKQRGHSVTVACTGKTVDGRQPGYFDELMRLRDSMGLENEFRVLGIVPYVDVQGLMAYACAVLNPSRFEGWSTTVEEAKTLQRPLLLSDLPVHREQAPRRGRFFGVDDARLLADLLEQAASVPPEPLDRRSIEDDYRQRLHDFGDQFIGLLRETAARHQASCS